MVGLTAVEKSSRSAVAVGMVAAAGISRRLGMISAAEQSRITAAIGRLGLPVSVRGVKLAAVRRAMAHDKKWFSGKNRWVLPAGIGRCAVRSGVSERSVRAALRDVMEG